MNNLHLAVQFFLQLAVILLFCRIVGAIALRLGQPQVVAEMLAGVLLGPSLFGLLWPEAQHWLFPWDTAQQMRDTQSYLFPASQLGLALYMFIVGMEFRVDIVKRRLKSSIAVSLAGMVTPFVLGAGVAWILFRHTELFPTKTSLAEAMLFLGASMCITAFPMLARIIHFKKLTGTTMGTAASRAAFIRNRQLGRVSFGHPRRWAWISTSKQRHIPITAAGMNPARNNATTEVFVTSPITIMKIAGGTSMPIAVPEAISEALSSGR